MKISEVADRTGLTASALRFYETAGIVTRGRAANGYRAYSETDVDALRFIARSKAVGLSLDEIAELLELRGSDRCAPLQDRLTELVAMRLTDTKVRAAELAAFTVDLEQLLGQLTVHQPDGPCDSDAELVTKGLDNSPNIGAPDGAGQVVLRLVAPTARQGRKAPGGRPDGWVRRPASPSTSPLRSPGSPPVKLGGQPRGVRR